MTRWAVTSPPERNYYIKSQSAGRGLRKRERDGALCCYFPCLYFCARSTSTRSTLVNTFRVEALGAGWSWDAFHPPSRLTDWTIDAAWSRQCFFIVPLLLGLLNRPVHLKQHNTIEPSPAESREALYNVERLYCTHIYRSGKLRRRKLMVQYCTVFYFTVKLHLYHHQWLRMLAKAWSAKVTHL